VHLVQILCIKLTKVKHIKRLIITLN